jgi:hypothetical protein
VVAAITTAAFIRVALNPTMTGIVSSIFSLPVLYPLATLSYTGYLCSFISAIHAVVLLDACNAFDGWMFTLCFILFSCINLTYATALSLLIERPFMKMR